MVFPWRLKIFPFHSFPQESMCPNESGGKWGQKRSCGEQSSLSSSAQAALRDSVCSWELERHPKDSIASYANVIKKLSFDTAVYDVASLDRTMVIISSELALHSFRTWWWSVSAYKTCCFIPHNLVPSAIFFFLQSEQRGALYQHFVVPSLKRQMSPCVSEAAQFTEPGSC